MHAHPLYPPSSAPSFSDMSCLKTIPYLPHLHLHLHPIPSIFHTYIYKIKFPRFSGKIAVIWHTSKGERNPSRGYKVGYVTLCYVTRDYIAYPTCTKSNQIKQCCKRYLSPLLSLSLCCAVLCCAVLLLHPTSFTPHHTYIHSDTYIHIYLSLSCSLSCLALYGLLAAGSCHLHHQSINYYSISKHTKPPHTHPRHPPS